MLFHMTIEMDNAAFEQDPHMELSRILRELSRSGELSRGNGLLRDTNGNTVGTWEIEGR